MEQWRKAPYAVLGTGDLAVEKATRLFGKAQTLGRSARRTDVGQIYEGLAGRGETLVKKVQRSKPAKRAVEGSKQASRQLKGAATSIRKAVGLEEKPTKKTSSRKAS